MWLLTIHYSFSTSPVLLLVAIFRIMCAQPMMFSKQKPWEATATSGFLCCTNVMTESKLHELSGIVLSTRANQYSTKAPSFFRSLILNRGCTCHGRYPSSVPYHLRGCWFTHTELFRRSPLHHLWLPVHLHSWDMHSPSKLSTWTIIPWMIQSFIACSCSSDIYSLLQSVVW